MFEKISDSGKLCFQLSRHNEPFSFVERILLESENWYSSHCSFLWRTKSIGMKRILFQLEPMDISEGELWRTPTHADYKNMGCSTQIYLTDQVRPQQVTNPKKIRAMKDNKVGDIRGMDSGSLNPTWVEWLMGYPIGWTHVN